MNDNKNLFREFPESTEADWIEKVEKDLKGKTFEELFWELNDDIKIAPFYHSIDNVPTVPDNKTVSNTWKIGEDILLTDEKAANQQLLLGLANGVNAPRIIVENMLEEDQLSTLFNNVELRFISIHFLLKKANSALRFMECFYKYLSDKNIDANEIKGSINHDNSQLPEIIHFTKSKLPGFKTLTINVEDASPAEIPKSLATAIAKAQECLADLNENGISPEITNLHLQFSASVGKSYFAEIAKLRALRILWANILEAYGLKDSELPPIETHLSPDSFGEDANANMIRSTIQAMAAVIGGTNRLTILPSDAGQSESTGFSRRIARNVQHLLMMESFFDRVIDPAKGSYYIETLTKKIAETAWLEFQKMKKREV